MKFCAILLAAGRSSRMGGIKALLPLPLLAGGGACSALEALARLYRAAGLPDMLVVSGFHADTVEEAARALSLAAARNAHPEQGMFSSVCAGLRAAPPDCDAFFIHPVDIPLVRPQTLRLLADAALEASRSPGNPPVALIPRHNGEEGHPPLLPAVFKKTVLACKAEGGLRAALAALPRRLVDTADSCVLEDMDSPRDYARLQRLALRRAGERPA
ncbi:MAG: nucleotidyltransferase family protein [Desulfovibrio sp.]|jgi:CTP:molybdopterin cytidylyltransferase MocA|nr:nucleotidyltransferase family protein [Desulfovibrio sp.]